MTVSDSAGHKLHLRRYFDGVGFERWSAIYGEAPVSRIRRTIRAGHEQMLAQASVWLLASHTGGTLLDAGCGTGLFTLAMAEKGFDVTAVDIAPRMVQATRETAEHIGVADRITFLTGDIEGTVSGRFDAAVCFDVLVHYPRESFAELCRFLANHTAETLIFTYAPYSRLLAALHWIGGRFPKQNRRTEIQMTPDDVVSDVLAKAGMRVKRTADISHGFYHVKLCQAVRG